MYENIKCNLCGNDNTETVYKSVPKEITEESKQTYTASSNIITLEKIVRCKKCGLIYINPRLRKEEIMRGYSDAVDEIYVSQEKGRLLTFQKGIRLVQKYSQKKGKILDIGCAAGYFLKVAKDAGWETFGAEPAKWMSEYGNRHFGVNIKAGTLEDAKFPSDFFDVVTMWDVLEHTTDPFSTLKEVNRIMKKGGVLIVNFPNIGDFLARLFGRKWWFILSVHLYYFTTDTLMGMLKKTSFAPIACRPHFQTLSFNYLVYRLRPYNLFLHRMLDSFVNTFKIGNLQIPYYASQTNIISTKK